MIHVEAEGTVRSEGPVPRPGSFTHRDYRMDRSLRRATTIAVATVLVLALVVLFSPGIWLPLASVAGLTVLAGAFMAWGERAVSGYSRDLGASLGAEPVDRWVHAEASQDIGLYGREILGTTPSPQRRKPVHSLLDENEGH